MRFSLQSIRAWLMKRNRVEVAPAAVKPPAPQPFRVLPETVEWTPEDVNLYRRFLVSETGRKLILICGGEIHEQAMAESAGDRATPKAFGMDQLLRFQFNLASEQTLSRASGVQDAKPDTAGSALDDAMPVEPRRSF